MKNNNNTTVQVVLTKRNGSLIFELPSGNKYEYNEQIIDIEEKQITFVSRVSLVSKNAFKRFSASFKNSFKQGELKGIAFKDIEIVTSLKAYEVKKAAPAIEKVLSELSVSGLSFRNSRYHKADKEGEVNIWRFLDENFLADLRVLSN